MGLVAFYARRSGCTLLQNFKCSDIKSESLRMFKDIKVRDNGVLYFDRESIWYTVFYGPNVCA